ncbi:MAG: hypothetical protein O2992_04920 [Gemmatimonadetes bacterium]|nr:hypothetical protein [Gemmatimonadota bacterium]
MYSRVTGACRVEADRVAVLKFGSSVLGDEAGFRFAAEEIVLEVASGRRVVAVVSAMGETTNRLLEVARCVSPRAAAGLTAQLLATGEDASVALLGIALTARGVNAHCLATRALGLQTTGPLDDAEPVGFDIEGLLDAVQAHDVVVVPGFVGWDRSGAPALLGRGGSDLTALYLAHALSAEEVRLIKDVDGVYEVDPKLGFPGQLPLPSATWGQVREIGNSVV